MYRKNTAGQYIYFCLVNATTGGALTGATVTAYRALDNGSQAAATGTTTELANGQYRFNLSQADTNAENGSYLFVATSAVPVEKTVVFTSANPSDSTAFGLSRVDAAISSRMATYTQPTGFLAATFPATVSSYSGGAVASVTAGVTVTTNNDKTGYSLTAGTGLGNQTANITGNLSGSVGSVTGAVGSVTSGVTVTTNNDKTGYSLSSGGLAAVTTWTVGITGNITGNLSGSVGSVTGAVTLDSAAIFAVADQVWDEATSGHTTAGTYGGRIVRATNSNTEVQITGANHIAADVHEFQTGVITAADFAADAITASALATDAVTEIQSGLATAAAITTLRGADNDTLKSLSDQIDGLSSATGSGARTVTITVNDGTTALQNARVRLTEGLNTYTGATNVSGVVVFNLDDATYTVGITKSGYTYAGTSLVVDGTETRTYSMTAISVTPPNDPALCAVTMHIYDQYGADMASQPVEITFVKWEDTATETPPVLSPPPVLSTDVDGIVSVEMFREATYKIVYGNAPYTRRVDVTIPDAATYTVEL